jgi:transposase-like protein
MPASIREEDDHFLDTAVTHDTVTRLSCPSCGSAHVAQVLGDNGGISYVCTACGHSWS